MQYLVSKGYICLHKLSDYVDLFNLLVAAALQALLPGICAAFSRGKPRKTRFGRASEGEEAHAADFSDFFFRFPAAGIDNREKMC